ncbi:hypothetical protein JW823_10370 [bacterium]|nr:hypothetical protein [candidate division CSSED10-310 bacterium]
MKESDLYLPVKKFLESQNYEVKAEIHACDVLAVRGDDEPVIVELKLSLNLDVILQAVDRQALTTKVYIGVRRQCRALKRRRKQVIKLLRLLGLGLLTIDPHLKTGSVEVVLDPGEYHPRKSRQRREYLLGEFVRRKGDPNTGGTDMRKGIMTAYRQRALAIGRFLQENGPTKASQVAFALKEPDARTILYRNVYGWFERESPGIYRMSSRGIQEIPQWQVKDLT